MCYAAGPTKYASFQYVQNTNTQECQCFDTFNSVPETQCHVYATYVWQYGPNVVVSNVARRRRREAAAQKALTASAAPHCPLGLSACRVAPTLVDHASYECINPLTELESCGGCVYGEMGTGNATGIE